MRIIAIQILSDFEQIIQDYKKGGFSDEDIEASIIGAGKKIEELRNEIAEENKARAISIQEEEWRQEQGWIDEGILGERGF